MLLMQNWIMTKNFYFHCSWLTKT